MQTGDNVLEIALELAASEPAHRPEFFRLLLESSIFFGIVGTDRVRGKGRRTHHPQKEHADPASKLGQARAMYFSSPAMAAAGWLVGYPLFLFVACSNNRRIQCSTKQGNPRVARQIEAAHKTRLTKGEVGIETPKKMETLKEFGARFTYEAAARLSIRFIRLPPDLAFEAS